MDFVGGGVPASSKASSKSEVLARAKAARAAREAGGGPQAAAARESAALAATRAARRLLHRARVRVQLAAEWHVPSEVLDAGALVSLVNRFLRIARRTPASHLSALCELSRAILASMDRADGGSTYAHALLSPHLAPLWRAQLLPLLAAVASTLEQAPALLGPSTPAPRDPNAPAVLQSWGVLVRLPLVLADVAKWRLAREQTVEWCATHTRLVESALHSLSARGLLSRAAAALVRAFEPSALASPVLVSSLLLAARPLQPERAHAAERAQCAAFACHVLAIPALTQRLGAAPASMRRKVLHAATLALCVACAPGGGADGAEASAALAGALDGAGALALLANGCALGAELHAPGADLPPQLAALMQPEPSLAPAPSPADRAAAAELGVGSARSSWALCLCACLDRLRPFVAHPGAGSGAAAAGGAAGAGGAAAGGAAAGGAAAAGGGGAASRAQTFHPLLGWVSGWEAGSTAAHLPLLEAQLRAVASPALLRLLWGEALAAPLRAAPTAGADAAGDGAPAAAAALPPEQCARAVVRSAAASRFALLCAAWLPARRADLLSTLSFATLLLTRLWALLQPLLPELLALAAAAPAADAPAAGAGGLAAGALGGVGGLLDWLPLPGRPALSAHASGSAHAGALALRLLELFARAMCVLLPTLDESEIDGAAASDDGVSRRFCRAELGQMGAGLNALAWACCARAGAAKRAPAAEPPPPLCGAEPAAQALGALGEPLVQLVGQLRERHTRARLCDEARWLLPAAARAAAEAEAGSVAALALLCQMPWAAPFAARVGVFRALVAADKLAVRGGDGSAGRPRTAPELLVTVRRKRLLHDGYAQLANQPAAALRRVLRVRFVSELGLSEAGIDHNGVFKEFMELVLKEAINADLGLFTATAPGGGGGGGRAGGTAYYANPHAGSLHEDAPQLFEFVGRMLGKALYEGVTLDVPLAPFFLRRVLGKASSIDELPELDAQLHSSLLFVRAYAGDMADLCLTFAIDVEAMGQHETVELKPGGGTVAVDKANRIQYVHLVSDYHLNRKIAPQAKAVHRGLMAVLQPSWLRLFSPHELGTLLAGDDVPIDIEDLRRHTSYLGGYSELSPTVRALWAVLKEFGNAERKAFLKFVTSCSQPPPLGFKHLEPRFAVQCVAPNGAATSPLGGMLAMVGLTRAERQRLPTAATCFNLLKLPDFRSKALLREKLLVAIHSNSGFELS